MPRIGSENTAMLGMETAPNHENLRVNKPGLLLRHDSFTSQMEPTHLRKTPDPIRLTLVIRDGSDW